MCSRADTMAHGGSFPAPLMPARLLRLALFSFCPSRRREAHREPLFLSPATAPTLAGSPVGPCGFCASDKSRTLTAEQHGGSTRRSDSAVVMRGIRLVALGGAAMLAADGLPTAQAGRGIPKTFQMNKTHVMAFNLTSKLSMDEPVCQPGTPEGRAMALWLESNNPGYALPCCDNGLFMPAIPYEYLWNNELRAFLYIITLLWCFVGVSVLADAFMAGIEAITAWTSSKQVRVCCMLFSCMCTY
jgi:hypothetical protein